MVGFWLLVLLFILLIFAVPWWPYSRTWGYRPVSILLAVLLIWLLLVWIGWVAVTWPESP